MLTKKEKKELEKEHEKNRKLAEEYPQYEEQYLKQLEDKLFSFQEKKGLYGFDAGEMISEYMEAWEIDDKKTMEKVLFESDKKILDMALDQQKDTIIEIVQSYSNDIRNILDEISTCDEAEIVIEALIGTHHITIMPKGYNVVKKLKHKNKMRNSKRCVPATYERALRRNRHMLEKDLNQLGIGQQRAKKISNILSFLK